MKEYKYKKEKRIIKHKEYNVIVPDKHSTIKALVFETKDLNADDDWANITRYYTLCMILEKGESEWVTLYDGVSRSFTINGKNIFGHGIYNLLFQLESDKVRKRIFIKAEIERLEYSITRDSIRLKELLENKKVRERIKRNIGE